MKRIVCSLLLVGTLFCSPALAAETLRVAVTIPPQVWLVNQIGGEFVQCEALVPAGADPHAYEPKPSQVTALGQAALYLSIGLEFEQAWLPRLTSANPAMKVVPMDAGVERIAMGMSHVDPTTATDGRSHGQYDDAEKLAAEARQWTDRNGTPDPHVWTDPGNMRIMAKNVFEALQKADPRHAEAYVKNYMRARAVIEQLETELLKLFAARMGDKRSFLVFHPSWGYFARNYALTQVAIETEGHEPSPGELAKVIQQAKDAGVSVILVQPQVSSRAAQVVADEIGAQLVQADPMAYDWPQNLRSVAQAVKDALR
ncbi:MAG: zinc ABC transporter substrate-binding protein [Proteobacteria bacterium]|nr:zinc ABC transporter substrate-binding protein [Pseudomonadota bacterium]